ncbi:MAG TPA: hypothetical protein VFY40_17515 [Blastocatellia bacterium]|nr:hypothetical protein [Blastocatellia bacterium]
MRTSLRDRPERVDDFRLSIENVYIVEFGILFQWKVYRFPLAAERQAASTICITSTTAGGLSGDGGVEAKQQKGEYQQGS